MAQTIAGLVRNIESMSGAESVYDKQFELAVGGGFGAWRVVNDYNNDENFDQDLFYPHHSKPNRASMDRS